MVKVHEEILANEVTMIGYVYVQPVICLLGFILNAVNSYIFCRKAFNAPAYLLMLALSIADAVTLFIRIPQGFIYYRGSLNIQRIMAIYTYIFVTYVDVPLTNMTENMSAWFTVSLAIERYVAMRHWNISRQYSTLRNVRKLIICIVCVAIVFNLPYFMIHNLRFDPKANGSLILISSKTALGRSSFYNIFSWSRMAVVQIIPLIFLCISNVLLLVLVYNHNQSFNKRHRRRETVINLDPLDAKSMTKDERSIFASEVNIIDLPLSNCPMETAVSTRVLPVRQNTAFKKKRNAQTKLTILLIAVILLFLFGEIPQAFSYVKIFEAIGACQEKQLSYCTTYSMYRMVTTNFALTSYGLTFFFYVFLNKHFRNELKKCVCHKNI